MTCATHRLVMYPHHPHDETDRIGRWPQKGRAMYLVTAVNDCAVTGAEVVAAEGYRHRSVVSRASGSVHTGLAVAELDPSGAHLQRHLHSYEEAFFVLEGSPILLLGTSSYLLAEGDYGVIQVGVPHAFVNRAHTPARWLEVSSPQPRKQPADTFPLPPTSLPTQGTRPDFADPRTRFLGHFEDGQLPPPSFLQMEGYSGGNVTGISLKMLVDRTLGAQHLNLFVVEFQPGGAGNVHDHPFEECYFFLRGEADAEVAGEQRIVRAGDAVWCGVGTTHGFFTRGASPMRWLETQAPQPPAQQAFRFASDWQRVADALGGCQSG